MPIAVSVQYLVDLVAVFDEIDVCSRRAGKIIATASLFSDQGRVRSMRYRPDRLRLYAECLRRTGRFEAPEAVDRRRGVPILWLHARRSGVVGERSAAWAVRAPSNRWLGRMRSYSRSTLESSAWAWMMRPSAPASN